MKKLKERILHGIVEEEFNVTFDAWYSEDAIREYVAERGNTEIVELKLISDLDKESQSWKVVYKLKTNRRFSQKENYTADLALNFME